ncbi:hypothetical protein DC28_07360 [Spirochaeta lutea]|uniref:Uncharacterized protein n=1 Tax=Spirochaeta lutea TaxID=1480694 RepID=A0A098QXI6_9SPIO|nr:hypothetical protein DC28_07360 [Spirochaeta lutea]
MIWCLGTLRDYLAGWIPGSHLVYEKKSWMSCRLISQELDTDSETAMVMDLPHGQVGLAVHLVVDHHPGLVLKLLEKRMFMMQRERELK